MFKKMQYCLGCGMASSATTVVSADGAVLEQILDATFTIWHEGLTRDAYSRWWKAQLRTPWGAAHVKRFALVEGDQVLASAKEYDLRAVVDGRPTEVLGLGAVFTQPWLLVTPNRSCQYAPWIALCHWKKVDHGTLFTKYSLSS